MAFEKTTKQEGKEAAEQLLPELKRAIGAVTNVLSDFAGLDARRDEISLELAFLAIHAYDRLCHQYLPPKVRPIFVDTLVFAFADSYSEVFADKRHAEFREYFLTKLKERQAFFARSDELVDGRKPNSVARRFAEMMNSFFPNMDVVATAGVASEICKSIRGSLIGSFQNSAEKEQWESGNLFGQHPNVALREPLHQDFQDGSTNESDRECDPPGILELEITGSEFLAKKRIMAAPLSALLRKFWVLWIVALFVYLVHRWAGGFVLALLFTFLLSILLWKMAIPYIRIIWSLGRMEQQFLGRPSMPLWAGNNLILAVVNFFATGYSIAGIWKAWPYVWAVLLFSAFVSGLNGTCAGTGEP